MKRGIFLVVLVLILAGCAGENSTSSQVIDTSAVEVSQETLWTESYSECDYLINDVSAQIISCAVEAAPATPTLSPSPTATRTPTNTPTSTSTPTKTPVLTSTSTPPPTLPPTPIPPPETPEPLDGSILSQEEIASAPMPNSTVLEWASHNTDSPNLSDQDDQTGAAVLAKAIVYAKTRDVAYQIDVVDAIESAMETENGGRTLALGRNLAPYVIAADLVNYRDAEFISWLDEVRYESLGGRAGIDTVQESAMRDASNWGANARASAVAAAIYLGEEDTLRELAGRFYDWSGVYNSEIHFGSDLSWHVDPQRPIGINPAGSEKNGHRIDGVIPDDQRRGGSFSWPPPCENYAWGNLQGTVGAAWLLNQAGYNAWNWNDQAVLRAVEWLYYSGDGKSICPATGDDTGTLHAINGAYNVYYDDAGDGISKNGMSILYSWLYKEQE